jgi:TonB-linked SusC/RagA family outer membrane protein
MRKLMSVLAVLMLSAASIHAQTLVVQGRVSDENGPVPNATVQEKGTRNSVVSDETGTFSIRVKSGATLTISAVGHASAEIKASGSFMDVTVATKPDELQEVLVSTAFGVKKSQRTAAFSTQVIKAEQLNVIRQPNLNNALAGKVAGVQFRGQSAAKLNDQGFLRIRGGGSLIDVGAIYVVNGTITNSFDINPDDVEDITVLKGANATALFGSRAANGAIVVSTKQGGRKKGIGIEVNQGVVFDRAAWLPNYQNEYGGGDGDWLTFAWNNTMPAEWQALNGKRYHDFTDDASWGPKMDGSDYIPWYAFMPGHSRYGQTAKYTPQPDNVNQFWNTGVTNNTNVSFSQSNGAGQNLRVSYTNQTIKGMIPNSKSIRHNLASSFNMELGRHFLVGANLTYTNQRIFGEFDDGYANNSSGNFTQWFHRNLDMSILKELSGIKTPIGTIPSWNLRRNPGAWSAANPAASTWAGNYWYNPYTWFENINFGQYRDRVYGDASLTYKLNSNFKVRSTVRTDQFNGNTENTVPNILQNSGGQTGYLASYSTSNTVNREWNFESIATYTKSIGDLALSVNAGGNRLEIRNRALNMSTNQGLNVPELYAIANSKATPNISNGRSDQASNSLFGFGDLEYRKFASLTWAVRNDWFSTLPAGNNSLLSPSVGGSLVFTEFTQKALPWLNFGKVFGSWGKKPKALGPYALNLNYSVNPLLWGSNFLMSTPDGTPDANLRGALVSTYEAGIDLRMFRNRLNLSVTYYHEDNRNEPLSVAVSGVSGFTSQLINAAWVQRKGIEVEFGVSAVKSKNFNWNINGTFSYLLDNPVKELAPGLTSYTLAGSAFSTRFARTFHFVGKQWGMLVGGGYARNDAGLPLITTNGFSGGQGWFVADANKEWGSVVPKITGGMQHFLSYKNFSLAVSADYQVGGRFFSLSEQWGQFSGLLEETAGLNDKGKPVRDPVSAGGGVRVQGVSAVDKTTPVDVYVDAYDYFHQFYYQRVSEPFIHSLTFVKVREMALGYQIPLSKLGGFGKSIQAANISIVARNPFILYRETKNFDPSEISGVNGEDGQLPGSRSLGVNLKFTF